MLCIWIKVQALHISQPATTKHTTCLWFDEDTVPLCEKLDVRCYVRANPIVLINSNRFIDPTSDGWIHSRSSEETEIIDLGFSYLEHLQCLCEGGEHCRELYLYHWASSETLKGINAEQKLYFLLFLTVNMSVYSVQRLCVISAVEMSDTSSSPACTAHTERQQVDLSV